MQKDRSTIAKFLLITYFLMVIGTVNAHHLSTSLPLNTSCKKVYLSGKATASSDMQLGIIKTEHEHPDLPISNAFSFCSSLSVYVAPVFTLVTTSRFIKNNSYCNFKTSLYSFLFQGLDPDPPKYFY